MANYVGIIRKSFKPKIQSFIDDWKARKDKENFKPNGMQMYSGMQGSGKTLTAVYHLLKLKARYPKAVIVTNLQLKYFKPLSVQEYEKRQINYEMPSESESLVDGLEYDSSEFVGIEVFASRVMDQNEYILFESLEDANYVLTHVNNGKYGVIYLIDEIHTYFNALESKNIPMFIFTEISQQRKQHKVILATSQLFMRMAKPFREQCDNVIKCFTWFGFITINIGYDGAALSQEGKEDKDVHARRMGWFFHTRYLRDAFDTYQKVISGAEQYDQATRPLLDKKSVKLLKK